MTWHRGGDDGDDDNNVAPGHETAEPAPPHDGGPMAHVGSVAQVYLWLRVKPELPRKKPHQTHTTNTVVGALSETKRHSHHRQFTASLAKSEARLDREGPARPQWGCWIEP